MLIICLVIFFAVFGVMFYSIIKHRKSKGARAANFHESTTVEIAWTIVPFIIVILMALPATRVVVAMKDTSAADLTIKATGYPVEVGLRLPQRRGRGHRLPLDARRRPSARCPTPASRPGDDYLLKVDNPLVVPVNKKVRIITTANDVIHAWGVPSLGVKQDAIPGFVRDAWFRAEKTGDYYGQCFELCGKEHAYMPIHVKVLSQQDYSAWVGERKKGSGGQGRRSEQGLGAGRPAGARREDLRRQLPGLPPGQRQGRRRDQGARRARRSVLDADKTKQIHVVLNGQTNGAMPAWKQL